MRNCEADRLGESDNGRLRRWKLVSEYLLATLVTKEEERKMIYGSIESVLTTKSKSIDS